MLFACSRGITASSVPGYTRTGMEAVCEYTTRHTLTLLPINLKLSKSVHFRSKWALKGWMLSLESLYHDLNRSHRVACCQRQMIWRPRSAKPSWIPARLTSIRYCWSSFQGRLPQAKEDCPVVPWRLCSIMSLVFRLTRKVLEAMLIYRFLWLDASRYVLASLPLLRYHLAY